MELGPQGLVREYEINWASVLTLSEVLSTGSFGIKFYIGNLVPISHRLNELMTGYLPRLIERVRYIAMKITQGG